MNRTFAIAILSTIVTSIHAQEPARAPHALELERHAMESVVHTKLRAAVETRTTKGAPYSAEATTEFTQVLGDGNRIARKSVTRIYRDGEGRMRREPVSPSAGPGDEHSITISDPIAGTSVILDPQSKTAYTSEAIVAVTRAIEKIAAERRRREDLVTDAGAVRMRTPAPEPLIATRIHVGPFAEPGGDAKREDLGTQTIEGVAAQGTRITTIVPAGAIGNEQPLTIVSEQWFSPDLQVLVMTRHSDPRSGETVYRLTNIVRAEPDRTLFEVPSDYTVTDGAPKKLIPVRRKH